MVAARKTLTSVKAEEVAAAKAEQARMAAEFEAVDALLADLLGSTWPRTYDTAAQALATPYVLRRLLMAAGEVEPAQPPQRRFDVGPGFVRARECPDCGHTRCGEDCTCNCGAAHAEHEAAMLRQQLADAQVVTTIDDTAPEGVLALLDAAADALAERGDHALGASVERCRDAAARVFDLPRRMRQWAYDAGAYKPETPRASAIERQAATLGAHDSAVLFGLLLADVASLPEQMRAAIAGRGTGEADAVERIAAAATALAGKLRGGK